MEGVPPFVMWTLIAIIMVLLGLLTVIAVSLRNLRRELVKFSSALDKLETRLTDQERQLAEIRKAVSERKDDPITAVINAVKKWRTKGLIPALSLLGTQLFRAYLGKKRRKSLPPVDGSE